MERLAGRLRCIGGNHDYVPRFLGAGGDDGLVVVQVECRNCRRVKSTEQTRVRSGRDLAPPRDPDPVWNDRSL